MRLIPLIICIALINGCVSWSSEDFDASTELIGAGLDLADTIGNGPSQADKDAALKKCLDELYHTPQTWYGKPNPTYENLKKRCEGMKGAVK